jgi:hypothetical protein
MLKNDRKFKAVSVWEHDVAGSNPVIPTKKRENSPCGCFLFFCLVCQFGSVLRSKMQVRIPLAVSA